MPKNPTAGKVRQHIEQIRNSILDEDLGMALKWVLQTHDRVEKPLEYIDENWLISATSLYTDAERTDSRFRTYYCLQLDTLGKAVKELAASYRYRIDAGLVLVLYVPSITFDLRNAGFSAKTQLYEPLTRQIRTVGLGIVSEDEQERVAQRNVYLDTIVAEIMRQNPTLVISPLFERTFSIHEIEGNELLEPEGVLLYRMLRNSAGEARKIKFLGIARYASEAEYWLQQRIPSTSPRSREIRDAVKSHFGINYSPNL